MKRLWIAAAIILTMAAAIGCHVFCLSRLSQQLSALLTQAQFQVSQENWPQGEALTRQALEEWEAHDFYLHAVMQHEDIDAIRISFQQALAYLSGEERQSAEYAAANAQLLTQLSLLIEGELPSLKNLL